MTSLSLKNISVRKGEATLLSDVSLRVNRGELVVLLGPNGAGKTTLLRAALGFETASSGEAYIGGDKVRQLSPIERARRVAYLPQTRPLAWPNTVYDIVTLGRYAYGAAIGRLGPADEAAIRKGIDLCDIEHLSHRTADTLSGGELARVHCARAFATDAPFLVVDEPVAALDPRHQFRVMDIISAFVRDGGGALVVLHDVALAARYADRLVWMKAGRILADGPPTKTLTSQRLAEVYDIEARVTGTAVHIEGALLP